MQLLCCGDRNWFGRECVAIMLKQHFDDGYTHMIEGEATGADKMCRIEGEVIGFTVDKMPAEWDRFGRAAGPIRNLAMLKKLDPRTDKVLAFHDNLEESKGTKHTVTTARKMGIDVEVVNRYDVCYEFTWRRADRRKCQGCPHWDECIRPTY